MSRRFICNNLSLYGRHPPLRSEYPTIRSKVNIRPPCAAFTTDIMFVCLRGVLPAAAAATAGRHTIDFLRVFLTAWSFSTPARANESNALLGCDPAASLSTLSPPCLTVSVDAANQRSASSAAALGGGLVTCAATRSAGAQLPSRPLCNTRRPLFLQVISRTRVMLPRGWGGGV